MWCEVGLEGGGKGDFHRPQVGERNRRLNSTVCCFTGAYRQRYKSHLSHQKYLQDFHLGDIFLCGAKWDLRVNSFQTIRLRTN
jgi:hypothetical protein